MLRRLLNWTKWSLVVGALTALFIWAYLYVESIHQRKKAEHFLSELTAFPFATADFAQVRDFTLRYGGGPSKYLEPGMHNCSPHECYFEATFLPATTKLLRKQNHYYHALDFAANHLGLRPWIVSTNFYVADGILQHTRTDLETEGISTSTDDGRPALIGYAVQTDSRSTPYSAETDYAITRPHTTGTPTETLAVWALHQTSGPWKHSLDIHLDCFTRVLRGCEVRELAPSTWADYEARHQR